MEPNEITRSINTMKPGLFKKILNSESEAASETVVAVPPAPPSHLPPPRRPDAANPSHDPFENDGDFGFSASEPVADATSPEPAFADPEENQMNPPAANPASSPPPAQSSESESIRQLELRAIFGVDHEMGREEILERSRMLKGIRKISLLADGDTGTIEVFKAMFDRLGFGSEPVKIYVGSVPVDFIREGRVALAVQTDSGYAPGVRETLIIVARELAKM